MKKFAAAIAAVGVLCVGAFLYLDHARGGIIGFTMKRALLGNDGSPARAEVNGISMYYETYGFGPPVLLLHGDFATVESMHHQIRALAESYLVIVPDRRAHGRTTDADGVALSYSLMAADMVALLDTLEIEKADVVGWSGGGMDGIEMAIRYPDRVGRLVTYGSSFHPDGLEPSSLAMLEPDNPSLSQVRSFYESLAPDPDRWPVYLGKMSEMWRTQPELTVADLGTIAAPTLIMVGEHDMVLPAHTEELAASIADSKLVIFEGQDHFAPLMAPEMVNREILAFMEE
ncbi:MAG: alpha/beta hydrolase [bacterium]|nr:alpha/beta hydrolase [bacterium]